MALWLRTHATLAEVSNSGPDTYMVSSQLPITPGLGTSHPLLAVVLHPFNMSTQVAETEGLCEFEASMICTASSRMIMAT